MIENSLRGLWRQGRAAVNGWLQIPHAFVAESIAHLGFDSVTCDMQHGLVDHAALVGMLTAVATTATPSLVRVPGLDPALIGQVLDAGAWGVICPMIDTASEAAALVAACRYAPAGRRSYGPNRASFFGPDYGQAAHAFVLPVAMIETRQALDNLDAILDTEGLAAIYVGPADLALSLGCAPQADPRESRVLDAIDHIARRAGDRGVVAGIHTGSAEGALAMIAKGYRLVSLPSDRLMMEMAARSLLGQVRAGQG